MDHEFLLILIILGILGLVWFWTQKRMKAMQKQMQDVFKSLSFDVLEKNGRQFLQLADATFQPFKDSIQQINQHQRDLETRREGAYAALTQQINGLISSERLLRQETARLVQSLRSSQSRGSWGEVQLKRVVELAGLVNHCDFYEQKTFEGESRLMRPDLVIRLPGQCQIAVDAKTPLAAYLEAAEINDEAVYKKKMVEHASALRKHVKDLSAKEYWRQFERAPEYVILFLPAESFFSAALQADPSLIELGADQNIIIATPTTLIAILRAVAHSWKQDRLSKDAHAMSRLGQELYERVQILIDHWNRLGRSLNASIDSYNQSTASLETRVLVSARKLKEAGSLSKDLSEISPIEKQARELHPLGDQTVS